MSNGQGSHKPNQNGNTPIPPQDHDVIIFPLASVTRATGDECYRIEVTRKEEATRYAPEGSYVKRPKACRINDEGIRKALSFMHPERFDAPPGDGKGATQKRGPAFAVAPVKFEPAPVSFCTCFLINADYFAEPSLWTLEEWNDAPGGPDYASRRHPNEVKALIALPWGQVLKLTVQRPTETIPQGGGSSAIAEKRKATPPPVVTTAFVDLEREPEIWQQLRNGCIAGRAQLGQGASAEVLPLVNITALMPLPPEEGKE